MAQFYKPKPRSSRQPICRLTGQLVVDLDHQGRGIIRTPQGTKFVCGTVPGDVISVTVDGRYDAQLERIEQPSSMRVPPACRYFEACGGCDLQHIAMTDQLKYKQQSVRAMLHKFAQVEAQQWLPPITGSVWHYRRRARLAIYWDGKRRQLKLGFRAAKSKQIIAVEHCAVLAQSLERLIQPLRQLIPSLACVAQLGHVELIEFTQQVVVQLRLPEIPSEQDQAKLQTFAEHQRVAIWVETDHGPQAVCPRAEPMSYSSFGIEVPSWPTDFMQGHRELSVALVAQALKWLEPKTTDHILELYAGSGNFTLPMATMGATVTAVEGVPSMVERLQESAAQLQLKVSAHCANLEQPWQQQPWAQQSFNKVLLDPARAGAAGAISEVAQLQPERIVYVSCAPDTLARDAQVLAAHGYQLKQAQLVDMFPQTHHIEVITLFERG